MATTQLFTFQDAAEHLWDTFNPAVKPPTGRELRMAKRAVIDAYRKLPMDAHWLYYQRRMIVTTEAEYAAGTVVYDHTGGSYERMVTLTGGTWPTNAARGVLYFNGANYPIESRKSNTVVTLGTNMNPGADVSSTTYTWYRESYPLPVNFRKLYSLMDTTDGSFLYPLENTDPSDALMRSRILRGGSTNRPQWYAVRNDGDYIGSMSILFGPAPSSARTYDMIYEIAPRELRTYKSAAGTVSVTAGSTTVTGASTAFSSFHVGSIIRFTTSTSDEPTPMMGGIDGTDNPFIAQRMITAVSSATSLTIDAAVSATTAISSAKYTISDPVDLEVHAMLPYFLRLAEYEYAVLNKREDWKKREAWKQRALLEAMAADVRSNEIQCGRQEGFIVAPWGEVDSTP